MMVEVSDLTEINAGLYAKTHAGGDMFYLMARDFDGDRSFRKGLEPNISSNPKLNKHLLIKGDILFASKGHNFFAAVYKEEVKPAIASSVFLVLKKKADTIYPEFLAWYLNHPDTQKILLSMSKGSTIPSLSKKTLSEIIIPVPSLETQKKIVEFEELRKKEIEIRTRLNKLHKELIDTQLLKIVK